MKTTNNVQKAENGRVKSMILRAAAIVVSLVLISWTVKAQDFWKEFFTNNSFGKMALLMVDQESETKSADQVIEATLVAFPSSVKSEFNEKTDADARLTMESWMKDDALFAVVETPAIDNENELSLEGWMISSDGFETESAALATDAEPALSIEPWMTNDASFSTGNLTVESDNALELENWMIDQATFGPKPSYSLKLEAWMADSKRWGY